tara:strand:+ start:2146 stop:2421 length:276 start_codon:yes stop_codon:yes gene_type:complete
MIPLDEIINKNNYTYTQVLKGKRYCLYEQNGIANNRCFELFKIKVSREKNINGLIIESKELFPKERDFGRTAWTICDLDKALAKFNELENE